MSTELAVRNNHSAVLDRIGRPDERAYLVQIMAEQIGIPAKDAQRTDVIALLGAAAQRTIQFGWIPGIHMHVQKFETEKSRKARQANPNLSPVYSYSLVDGEKAWKDSGTRWRDRGVNWTYQRKPMTRDEVAEEARLQGYTQSLAPNAYGMWSRILIIGQDNPNDPDNPMWSAGIYFGKVKAGNFWRDDVIPTGISARDIAIRRADKRAMMQSTLTLLPVDDLSVEQRVQRLTDNLRHEAQVRDQAESILQRPRNVIVEDDGDILWASSPNSPAPKGEAQPQAGDDDDIIDVTVDFETEVVAAGPEDEVDFTRPGVGERPINTADGPCPECHAPAGKMHATGCPAVARPDSSGARPAADPGARPADPGARPKGSGARPADPGARPEKVDARPVDPMDAFFDELAAWPIDTLTLPTAKVVRKVRNAHEDSTTSMSAAYYKALVSMIQGVARCDADAAEWIMTLMLGFRPTDTKRPGQLVHGQLMKAMRDEDAATIAALTEILKDCSGHFHRP